MGECSTQELMEEQLSKSWQRNKLTIEIYIFLRKGRGGLSAEVHHWSFAPSSPHRLSAVSETLSEKEGSPVGVPINMYCNSLYIEKNYCKVKFNFTLMALALCVVCCPWGDVA